ATVGGRGVRARALMEDRRDVVVEIAVGDAQQEFFLVDVVGDAAADEIAELVALRQVVDGDDVTLAARVQRLDQVGSDESGGAGHDDVHDAILLLMRWALRSRSRTARAPRRRTAIRSRPCPPRWPRRRWAVPRPTA